MSTSRHLGLVKQTTLQSSIELCGVGLHSGSMARVIIKPAAVNTGIIFYSHIDDSIFEIPVDIRYIRSGHLRTELAVGVVIISTMEHLLAAINAHGLTNLIIHIWGSELPILDGSSIEWFSLILDAGIVEQSAYATAIKVLQRIEIADEYSRCSLDFDQDRVFEYSLSYDHPVIGQQYYRVTLTSDTFGNEIAASRTFGFIKDLTYLTSNGLALGANTANVVVFDHDALHVESELRWDDEPVRHKLLDAVGDLMLAGYPIIGKFSGHRSGHDMNHKLVQKLLNTPDAWCYTSNY